MSKGFEGVEKVYEDYDWWANGVNQKISKMLGDLAYEGAEFMHEKMAKDTGWMKATMFVEDGHLKTSFGTSGTDYAGINDGMVSVSRPYTTTPFFNPTVDFMEKIVKDKFSEIPRRG